MLTLTLSEPVEEMAVAYFIVHARQGNFFNEGEPALPYCFIFLLLAVAGGGSPEYRCAPCPQMSRRSATDTKVRYFCNARRQIVTSSDEKHRSDLHLESTRARFNDFEIRSLPFH